jgi:hypothetical protein
MVFLQSGLASSVSITNNIIDSKLTVSFVWFVGENNIMMTNENIFV